MSLPPPWEATLGRLLRAVSRTRSAGMTNTVLHDVLTDLGRIGGEQIQAIADVFDARIAPLAAKVDTLSRDLEDLKGTAQAPQLSGEKFESIRKCLQLLTRLEEWDLADKFDPKTEFRAKEFERLKSACLSSIPAVEVLLDELENSFPDD